MGGLVENFYYVSDSVCQVTLKKFFLFSNSIERVIRPIFINLKETFVEKKRLSN